MSYYSTYQVERRVEVNWFVTVVLTEEGEGGGRRGKDRD